MKRWTGRGVAALVVLLVACGGGGEDDDGDERERGASGSELTEWQEEHGIGPIQSPVAFGEYDAELAARGAEVFRIKCGACHKADERYVGPALGDVLDRRTPEYAMNMMLNPAEMVQKHPEARALLAQFMTPMPFQNLTEEDARAVVEYLRDMDAEPGS